MGSCCGSNAPEPPSPQATASAQTATNVSTAIANAFLNNVNQTTPTGSLTYNQSGKYDFTDPLSGSNYSIPQFTATQNLSPAEQEILKQQESSKYNLAGLANQQSGYLYDFMGRNFDPSGVSAPQSGNAAGLASPNYSATGAIADVGNPLANVGPYQQQSSTFADNFGGPQSALAPYGQQQSALGATPGIGQNFADAGSQQFGFGGTGGPTYGFGDAGDITRSYGQGDFTQDRSNVENALYQRLQPQLQIDRQRLETQLQDQGIRYGSPAYNQAIDQLNRQQTDARLAVTAQGGQEQALQMNIAAQRAGFQNAAQMQAYQQAQGRGQFYNTAEQQAYQEALGRGQFANTAQQAAYEQALGRGTFANQAAQTLFGQEQARGQFANAAQQAAYQQALGAGQFANTAQQQAYAQAQGRGEFANTAQAQNFAEQAQAAQFAQAAQQAAFGQAASRAQFGNAGAAQNFQQAQSLFNAQNALRNQYMQEQYAARNQPINQISALLSGSQVNQPNFVNAPSTQIPTTDYAGLVNQNFNQQLGIYQTQQNAQNQLLGGIFGAAGNFAKLSDVREKKDIHRIGTVFAASDHQASQTPSTPAYVREADADELPIYSYAYKGDPTSAQHIGPMAQDVEDIDPSAVHEIGGRKYIDNRKMSSILRAA